VVCLGKSSSASCVTVRVVTTSRLNIPHEHGSAKRCQRPTVRVRAFAAREADWPATYGKLVTVGERPKQKEIGKKIMLNRRNFMVTTTAALGTAMLPFTASSLTMEQNVQDAVLKSFPHGLKLSNPTLGKHMAYFLSSKLESSQGQFSIEICKEVSVEPDEAIKTAFPDDIEVLDMGERNNTHIRRVSSIVSAGSKIAVKTLRGRGNFYAVFPDHILVWYRGELDDNKHTYDTPIQVIEDTIVPNKSLKNYFVKVEGVLLTDEDHAVLESSFTRIA
jgi:hypothetical protein